MGTRTEDLTPAAKPVAERLARRLGHLKLVLSAGVIALEHLDATDRETILSMANDAAEEKLDLYAERKCLKLLRDMIEDRYTLAEMSKEKAALIALDGLLEVIDSGLSDHLISVNRRDSEATTLGARRLAEAMERMTDRQWKSLNKDEQNLVGLIREKLQDLRPGASRSGQEPPGGPADEADAKAG